VILRDNTVTGVVDVLDVAKAGHVSWGEAEDRRDLRRYVEAREGYDWETIQDMYDLVKLMTDGKERDRYVGLYDQNKPDSPLALYKDRYRIIAKASTITFVGSTAQVFYSRKFIPLANAVEKPHTEYGVATIAYEHRDITKKESEREANPTGFTVLSYTPERDWTRATESGNAPGAAGIAVPAPVAASTPAASSGGAR
jgi:type IV secretion system protein VirB8